MAVYDEMSGYTISIADKGIAMSIVQSPKYVYRVWINSQLAINILEGKEPNWFNRWLQKIFLGFRWEKIDESHQVSSLGNKGRNV